MKKLNLFGGAKTKEEKKPEVETIYGHTFDENAAKAVMFYLKVIKETENLEFQKRAEEQIKFILAHVSTFTSATIGKEEAQAVNLGRIL